MSGHSEACQAAKDAADLWREQHPDFCKTCGGSGFVDASDPSVGLWGNEPCEDCVCEGKCPVCGHQHGEDWNNDEAISVAWTPCEVCGWTEDKLPPQWECFCYDPEKDWHEEWDRELATMLAEYPAGDGRHTPVTEAEWAAYFAASDLAYDAAREGGKW